MSWATYAVGMIRDSKPCRASACLPLYCLVIRLKKWQVHLLKAPKQIAMNFCRSIGSFCSCWWSLPLLESISRLFFSREHCSFNPKDTRQVSSNCVGLWRKAGRELVERERELLSPEFCIWQSEKFQKWATHNAAQVNAVQEETEFDRA